MNKCNIRVSNTQGRYLRRFFIISKNVKAHDISAEYIDKDTSKEDTEKILKKARKGRLNFLYVTPKRLQNSTFLSVMKQTDIFMVVVDECHCVT